MINSPGMLTITQKSQLCERDGHVLLIEHFYPFTTD